MIEMIYHLNTPVSVALLADLHGRPFDSVISSLTEHKPEIICIAGDILYGSHPLDDRSPLETQEHVLPFLRSCVSLAPTYLSLGNHEWMLDEDDLQTIASTGVTILDNNWVTITVDDRDIVLAGLTSAYVTDYRRFVDAMDPAERAGNRYPRKNTIRGIGGLTTASEHVPETAWLSDFAAQSGFKIIISHHPEYITLIPESVELVCSGHGHGGQWSYYSFKRKRMCGLFAPGQGWFPKYTKGLYENRLIVSAGLSNTARVPRLFNPTEIVYINC